MSRDNLITLDLSPLRSTLDGISGEMKRHWTEILTLTGLTDDAKMRMGIMDRHIADVRTQCELFQQGLESVKRMDEKLDSWSERFRALEERQLHTLSLLRDTQIQSDSVDKRLSDELFSIKSHIEVLHEENPQLRNEVGLT